MRAPNHIVGGLAITGISLSFWDINIFSNQWFLGLCVFFSILPDVDHRKSIIGKIFLPLAKYLDRNYGHRTITHSFLALGFVTLLMCLIELNIVNPVSGKTGLDYTAICFFSYLSHLILDMLTIHGVPLFYPFARNPCVMPGNRNLRFRSGDIKAESIAMVIFCVVLFTSMDLFRNGFWTSYNRSFGTVKHAYREFKSSDKVVAVEYEYTYNGEKKKGQGYILESTENTVEIWPKGANTKSTFIINTKDNRFQKIKILPSKTSETFIVEDFRFYNASQDEVNEMFENEIVSGKITSNKRFLVDNIASTNQKVEIGKIKSPWISILDEEAEKNKIRKQLKIKQAKLNEIKKHNKIQKGNLDNLKRNVTSLNSKLSRTRDIFSRNEIEEEIIQTNKKIEKFKLKLKDTEVVEKEIEVLFEEIEEDEKVTFSGDVKLYRIPI